MCYMLDWLVREMMMLTTNVLLQTVLAEVDQLIEWACADCERSRELGALAQARDDLVRVDSLRKAKQILQQCKK
jgi:hypothetical protein